MRQHGEHRFTACTLDAPDGETAKPNAGIVGVASQKAAAGTGRCVVELKANGEDEGEDELDERFAIAKVLRVGRLIVEIDSEGAILAWCFGGLCHVSSPLGWWLIRMRHGESNILKDQAYWKRLRVLPWLTDKTPALHFSSRFLPLKHKSKLPAFGILLL
jgi:hypothetical protein